MRGSLFAHYNLMVREAFAAGLDCPLDAFASERLTIVPRPAAAPWPYIVMATTFGTGTVLSVDPAYIGFTRSLPVSQHYRAMHHDFLGLIQAEGKRRGEPLTVDSPNLGFTLASLPPEPVPPPAFELRTAGAAWMRRERMSARFENALGLPGTTERDDRDQFALALIDAQDHAAAVAGVLLTYGMLEIGVDTVPEHRGHGLGRAVVAAALRAIVDHEATPFYGCAATNIRSHRTAEASGLTPVCSNAFVSRRG